MNNDVICVIMAGGVGSRLRVSIEKPLINILGKPMIEYIITAVSKAKYVKDLYVATSPHTPRTEEYLRIKGINVIKTPGNGYVKDLRYVLNYVRHPHILVCPADTPLLSSEDVDLIVETYFKLRKPSLVVVIPLSLLNKLGITPEYVMEINGLHVAPCGISVISRDTAIRKEILEEGYLIMRRTELALNVNTIRELKLAINMLRNRNFSK